MSIFGKILSKIFPSAQAQTPPAPPAGAPAATAPAPAAAAPAPAPMSEVDVVDVLDAMAQANGQKLNWKTSIVDLMKLLNLDSSLSERQALAKELGYSGDMNDSASMNIWLHKQVMKKLADNGGIVPAELKD